MANWANSNLPVRVLLQIALREIEAIFSWSKPAVVRLCFKSVPSKRETARGQRPEFESPQSLETLKSTAPAGIGLSEAGGPVLMFSAEPSATE
jgi:hypothetical protein